MKVMSILGTRPEIIRLSRVIPLLDQGGDHVLVHTGQNYDKQLSDVFFADLGVRAPDLYLHARGDTFGGQIGEILAGAEAAILTHRPDRLVILGDTNSGLTSIVAKRLGVPVFHMEAGNRCYDDRVPEEVNRRVIDHSSSVLLPYTNRSRENLLREGIPGERIYVTGNPINQVINHYRPAIDGSSVLSDLGLDAGGYILVTMHRAENVDIETRLRSLVRALAQLHEKWGYPVVTSFHPRTRDKVMRFGVDIDRAGLRFVEPLGFFDFVRLEQDAFCILSDSGTVQEEACILGKPNVTIRDVTERPETLEAGSNILSSVDPSSVFAAVEFVTSHATDWQPPPEYLAPHVAETVARIVLGHHRPNEAEQAWLDR